jgi:hypothetical protein
VICGNVDHEKNVSIVLILVTWMILSGATPVTDSSSPQPAPRPSKAGQKEKASSAGETQKTKTNEAPSNQSPPKIDLTETQKASEVSEKTKDQKTEPSPTDWWIMVFTGVLACAAIIQVFVYGRQAQYMQQGLRLTSEAVNAAQKSADVATRQVQIMASSERPWIMIQVDKWGSSPIVYEPQYGFGGGPVDWSAINVGKSPGFLTDLVVVVDTVPYPIVDQRPDYPTPQSFAKFIIPPNGKHSSKISKPIDAG